MRPDTLTEDDFLKPIWHTMKDVDEAKSDAELIAIGLTMWANCMAGNEPPEYFGDMMVKIGQKLEISPRLDEFSRLADEFLTE